MCIRDSHKADLRPYREESEPAGEPAAAPPRREDKPSGGRRRNRGRNREGGGPKPAPEK